MNGISVNHRNYVDQPINRFWLVATLVWTSVFVLSLHCSIAIAQIRLPAIDPSGNRIFLPAEQSTSLLGPFNQGGGLFGHHRNSPPPATPTAANSGGLFSGLRNLHHNNNQGFTAPTQPAFTHPAPVAPCNNPLDPNCGQRAVGAGQHLIPKADEARSRGAAGEIVMTPARIIAPVGSEVVVLAGICGSDGYYVINQPLEWMLSNDSVGQIIEVGGMEHPNFNRMVPPTSQKFDGQYAWGRSGLKEKTVTRGTPTPVDDIDLIKGQTYISLSSASAGTSYLTCVAPQCKAWDKRRATTLIHWVDGVWAIPLPVIASSGSNQSLTTVVTRVKDGEGIPGWKVRYSIVGGTPAEFVPTGSQTAELETNTTGQAIVQLRQQPGNLEPGTTQVRVDVIRPAIMGESELVVESGLTSVTWSAPALTIRVTGPQQAGVEQPYNYRIEVSNPGDQPSRDVRLFTTDITGDLQFISSNPKPAAYGNRLEWNLGTIPPGSPPQYIDVQMKSDKRGMRRVCFGIASQTDNLQTQACAETEVAAPCIGMKIDGPSKAFVNDDVTFAITVFNQCDDALQDVYVEVNMDTNLVARDLPNPIRANVGNLAFGEKKTLDLTLRVLNAGAPCFVARATAAGGNSTTIQRCLDVSASIQGQARIDLAGQQIVRVGQQSLVRMTLTNTGNVPLNTISLTHKHSPSLQISQLTDGFQPQRMGNDLSFPINSLQPGQSTILELLYNAIQADGNAFVDFVMTTPSGAQASQRLGIRIDPERGLNEQPIDNQPPTIPQDPLGSLQITAEPLQNNITVGQTVDVRFSIRNDRASSDRNVNISFLVPPGLAITNFNNEQGKLAVSTNTPDRTSFTLERRMELLPNEQLIFVVTMQAIRPGQYTFEVQANSEQSLGTITQRATINVIN